MTLPGDKRAIRRALLDWYRGNRRDLPWRRTTDPYRVLVSEVMLQQTRVAAVIPYYERFLERFPSVEALAAAPEQDVLAAWAGLGYYSRARNLQKAAKQIAERGDFPGGYDAFRALAGVGDYTAAAIASICFNQPRAAVDGNVLRVMSRFNADSGDIGAPATRRRLGEAAQALVDPKAPGDFNQAMMELGATICAPRDPRCLACPIARWCSAREQARQSEFPVKLRGTRKVVVEQTLLVVRRGRDILLWQRPPGSSRMAGFWELPEVRQLPEALLGATLGRLTHQITVHRYEIALQEAKAHRIPPDLRWVAVDSLKRVPLSTITRKALALLNNAEARAAASVGS